MSDWGDEDSWGDIFRDFDDLERFFSDLERRLMTGFDEMLNQTPPGLIRQQRLPDGRVHTEVGPIVYGYSVTIGPDGKPKITQFGNVNPEAPSPVMGLSDKREPLVDVTADEKQVRVIAEIAGADKDKINFFVSDNGKQLVITAENTDQSRKYEKVVDLPTQVRRDVSGHTYNNGILEVFLARV
jgi:HSP20 family protein